MYSCSSARPAISRTSRSFPRSRHWCARGRLDMPIVAVGRKDLPLDDLRARARESIANERGPGRRCVRKALGADALREGGLRRRGDLRAHPRGDRGGQAPSALRRSAARCLRDRRHEPGEGRPERGRAPVAREAVRRRPQVGRGAERGASPIFSRGGDLPYRPFPRQGIGREPDLLPRGQPASRGEPSPRARRSRSRSRWPSRSA